jgi:subtilisin-like proprotein convertase family protein
MKKISFLAGIPFFLLFTNEMNSVWPSAAILKKNSSGNSVMATQKARFNGSVCYSSDPNTLNSAIPDDDANGINDIIPINSIPLGSTIDSIIVTFSMAHSWLSDVVVNLEAPNGQIINLVGNRGGNSIYGYNNVRVTSDNSLPAFPTGWYGDPDGFSGTYKADAKSQADLDNDTENNDGISTVPAITTQTFSQLFTLPNGDWKIRVYDVYTDSYGTLIDWSVKICYTPPTPTPVTLYSFSGYRDNNQNILLWSTAAELNNRGFQLERSADGMTYSSIGFILSQAPAGNSNAVLHYSFTDHSFSGEKQFYRLRQIDFSGNQKLSHIVLIKSNLPGKLNISGVFPNPANNILNVIIAAPGKRDIKMLVMDMTGKTMQQKTTFAETGFNTIPMDVSQLAGGMYLLKIISSSHEEATLKFIRQ